MGAGVFIYFEKVIVEMT